MGLIARRSQAFSSAPNDENQPSESGEASQESQEGTEDIHELHEAHRVRTFEHLREVASGEMPESGKVTHPKLRGQKDAKYEDYVFPHKIWSEEECAAVAETHDPCEKAVDYAAYACIQALRFGWDLGTGYLFGRTLGWTRFSHKQWVLRVVYLESIAGVPGMMFAMVRHLQSLRTMQRDHGWIHTLLSEAENERMHLLIALNLYKPSVFFRYLVLVGQGVFSNFFFLAYLFSPRFCHRLVGYLEEEAVHTYTNLLSDIDAGKYPEFNELCSNSARGYWHLPEDATWRDVIHQIRADETLHRDVNHALSKLRRDDDNPYRLDEVKYHQQNSKL